nr:Chain C, VAL-PRO-LEU-THR-GLU-ASP-ALA-GLU-LEU [synthetic construct]
VPLTEDAEL